MVVKPVVVEDEMTWIELDTAGDVASAELEAAEDVMTAELRAT